MLQKRILYPIVSNSVRIGISRTMSNLFNTFFFVHASNERDKVCVSVVIPPLVEAPTAQ
jgi:hypothetical protein